jgi:hypothetical protein
MASILLAMYVAPAAGRAFGCSAYTDGGSSQLTVGSLSLRASYSNWPVGVVAITLSYRQPEGQQIAVGVNGVRLVEDRTAPRSRTHPR